MERFEIAPRQHTDLILPMIESLLNECQVERSQLEAIAFSQGPGSFMGTRLATGVAQGLGYALKIPLIPVSTLQILAQTAYEAAGEPYVVAGWDARMKELYWGAYRLQNGLMQMSQPDVLQKPEAVVVDTEGAALVGNAWSVYKEALDPMLLTKASSIDTESYPHSSALITLALARYDEGDTRPALGIEPVYWRNQVTS